MGVYSNIVPFPFHIHSANSSVYLHYHVKLVFSINKVLQICGLTEMFFRRKEKRVFTGCKSSFDCKVKKMAANTFRQ